MAHFIKKGRVCQISCLSLSLASICYPIPGFTVDKTNQIPATGTTENQANTNDDDSWSFDLELYGYLIANNPVFPSYGQPAFTADKDWLHLELRYNYEDLQTGSAWIGYNFSFGEQLKVQATPIVGGVFGKSTGIGVGFETTIDYEDFELSSESEGFFHTDTTDGDFFYNWSELSYSLKEWVRFGMAYQKSNVWITGATNLIKYKDDVRIAEQLSGIKGLNPDGYSRYGFLIGGSIENLDITFYFFDPGKHYPTAVIGLEYNF